MLIWVIAQKTPPPHPGDTLRRGVRLLQDHSAARAGRSSLCVRRAPHRVARGSGLRPCPARPLSGLPLRLCAQHSLPFVLQRLLSGFERPVLGSGEIHAGSHSTCSTPHPHPQCCGPARSLSSPRAFQPFSSVQLLEFDLSRQKHRKFRTSCCTRDLPGAWSSVCSCPGLPSGVRASLAATA